MNKYEIAAAIALLLVEKGRSIYGRWAGRMTAREQRAVFGTFLGKGLIIINGAEDTVTHRRKVCFGLDWDDTIYTVAKLAEASA